MNIDELTAIGTLARFHPSVIPLLETLEIDYACKGGRSIRDAASFAGHDPNEVVRLIREAAGAEAHEETETLAEIIHHVITDHHRFASEQLRGLFRPLGALQSPPEEVVRIRRIVASLTQTIGNHMLREERKLFPPIELLESHPHRVIAGSMSRPLLAEFVEHDVVHTYLSKIRELAGRVRAKTREFDELLDDIAQFDRDAHRHIHLENNVLIPRVVSLENRLKAERSQQQLVTR